MFSLTNSIEELPLPSTYQTTSIGQTSLQDKFIEGGSKITKLQLFQDFLPLVPF